MKTSHYHLLIDKGVPLELLARLAQPPTAAQRSPIPPALADQDLPSPPTTAFPAAIIPQSAVDLPDKEPKRQNELVDLAPAYSIRLWFALNEANNSGLRIGLFEGVRTPERQVWLYAQGRTLSGTIVTNAATVFASWHGYGLAADCVPINSANEYNWPIISSPIWLRWLGHAAKFGLTTGIHWTRPVDAPHTQPRFVNSYPKADDKSLLASGGLLAIWQKYDQLELSDSFFDLL